MDVLEPWRGANERFSVKARVSAVESSAARTSSSTVTSKARSKRRVTSSSAPLARSRQTCTLHEIVVRGAVRGDLSATESIHLEDGARVVGDVRAPRIAIAQARSSRVTSKPETQGRRSRAPSPRRPAPRPPHERSPRRRRALPPRLRRRHRKRSAAAEIGSGEEGGRQPRGAKIAPKPVVPVLKKGAKGTLAKKRG